MPWTDDVENELCRCPNCRALVTMPVRRTAAPQPWRRDPWRDEDTGPDTDPDRWGG